MDSRNRTTESLTEKENEKTNIQRGHRNGGSHKGINMEESYFLDLLGEPTASMLALERKTSDIWCAKASKRNCDD